MYKYILLIDDDEDDQLIFKDAVQEISADIECMTALNGQDALEWISSASRLPDLIFLDLNMPFMNGFEFLSTVKKNSNLRHIPIIIYTTSNNPADQKSTMESGADHFFTKTSDYRNLKNKLVVIFNTEYTKA